MDFCTTLGGLARFCSLRARLISPGHHDVWLVLRVVPFLQQEIYEILSFMEPQRQEQPPQDNPGQPKTTQGGEDDADSDTEGEGK